MEYENSDSKGEDKQLVLLSKSSIVSPTINDVDVFGIVSDQDYVYQLLKFLVVLLYKLTLWR